MCDIPRHYVGHGTESHMFQEPNLTARSDTAREPGHGRSAGGRCLETRRAGAER